jgi:hypothetical protein
MTKKITIPKIILKQIFACDKCVFFTFDKDFFNHHKHIQLHEFCSDQCYQSGLHQCPNCEYQSKDKYVIANHIRYVHLKVKHISCNICDFQTISGIVEFNFTANFFISEEKV